MQYQHFAVSVHQAPYAHTSAYQAYCFTKALVKQGHKVIQVFFYEDGVMHAQTHCHRPTDEINMPKLWQELSQKYDIPLICCLGTAHKRGIQERGDIEPGFQLEGLGAWVEAVEAADKVVQF